MDVTDYPRCATCRHWQVAEPGFRRSHPDHGYCAGVGAHTSELPEPPTRPAFTTDLEQYSSALYTLPTFGCVLHETKGTKEAP